MHLQLFCATFIIGVLSDKVTFKNVTIQYQTFEDYYQSSFDIVSAKSLKDELPENSILRVTVVGTVPVIYEDAITDLPDLKILQLQRLKIEDIQPGSLKNLPLLEVLRVNTNRIKTIKEGVFSGLNVVFLNLEQNLIETIALKAFDDLPKLKVLSLDGNKLTEFHPEWLEGKPELVTVSFMYNEIEELPKGAFATYHNDIFFNNNRIKRISSDMFGSEEKKLGQLWVKDNYIDQWEEGVLKGAKIRAFDISNNKLECLDGNFDNFFVAYQTRIDGNPWDCECLVKVAKWVSDEKSRRVYMRSSLKKCNITNH